MENVPKETETIAAKRSIRLAEKLNNARAHISKREAWWNGKYAEVLLVGLGFLINAFTIYSYYGTQTSEDTFFSGPIVPILAKILMLSGLPLSFSLQAVNIAFILFFPPFFYLLAKQLTGRKIMAILALLLVSLPVYPFSFVRVTSSLAGLDGAHISSLTISCLALMFLFKFIKEGGIFNLTISSAGSALVALTSPFGFSTYFIMSFIMTFSEMLLGFGRLKLLRFMTVLVFTFLLVSFWYNPSFAFWLLTGSLGEEVRGTVFKLLPMSFFIVPALGAFGYLLFDRKPNLQPVFLASFFTISFLLISVAGGGVFPSHPSRYVAELGISLAILLSVVIIKVAENLKIFEDNKFYFRLGVTILMVLLTASIILGKNNMAYDENVLGLWTGVEKGTIWQEREKFDGISTIFGAGFTITGIGTLTYLNYKTRKAIV